MDSLIFFGKLLLLSIFMNVSMGRPIAQGPCPRADNNCLRTVVGDLLSWKELIHSHHIKEITSLKEEITALKNQYSTVKNESSSQKKEITALIHESSSLQNETLLQKKELTALKKESSSQKSELAAMNKEVVKLQEDIAVLNETKQDIYAEDCTDIYKLGFRRSGVYTLSIKDAQQVVHNVPVYCDMDTTTGGWTVFQRRQDGSVPFNRTWEEYKHGFGHLQTEFWLGNTWLSMITSSSTRYTLRVDLESFNNGTRYAEYKDFQINNETDQYRLNIGSYSGTAGGGGNGLSYSNQMQFSTIDQDNDNSSANCALNRGGGGFWYKHCDVVNTNSLYRHSAVTDYSAIHWKSWLNYVTLKRTEMKFKPLQ